MSQIPIKINLGAVGGPSAEAGADVFLVPNDLISKEVRENFPATQSNYQEALTAKKKVPTDMKKIPIGTAQDAVDCIDK